MKKRVVCVITILLFIFLVGCVDYKAYDIPKEDNSDEELSLIDEIAQIEEELAAQEDETKELETEETLPEFEEETGEEVLSEEEEVVEEVIIPELSDETEMEIINVKENEFVKLRINISDPDKDAVTYSFTRPLSKTGEWKTNYGDAGEYIVTITASDGKLTTTKKIKIMVERVNVAPVIEPLKDLVVNEGKVVEFEAKVNDPNNDPVNVVISEPLKSYRFVTDHTSAGEYQIKVVASDGELETEKSFKLTVKDVNVLPDVSNIKDLKVKEGETVEIKPVISDLDEDEITLTISEPVGNDGVWATTFTDHGNYSIIVTADDGKDKVIRKVNVVVEDVNMPPEIVEVGLFN